jgi:hypothetical protein
MKCTREAICWMLSATGNPELRSLTAILDAAWLRLTYINVAKDYSMEPACLSLHRMSCAISTTAPSLPAFP